MAKNITVCRFEDAQEEGWAPGGGVLFDWAWRVELPNDSTIVGGLKGTRKQANEKAQAVAKRAAPQAQARRIIHNRLTNNPHPFARALKS